MNFRCTALMTAAIVLSGCSTTAPVYTPSFVNTSALKAGGAEPVAVGAFTVDNELAGAHTLNLRAVAMASSAGANYADYVAEALRAELRSARRFDPKASVDISGVLLKNVMNANGVSRGEGTIEARFVVRRDGAVRFDRVKTGATDWASSFIGGTAINNAARAYPQLVQSLLAALYADPDFLAAIR